MKILLFIKLFVFGFLLCNAQQKIMFLEKGNQQEIRNSIYTLPTAVTCTFGNKVKRDLVLEKVQGDSFYFEQYYNQEANYDCLIKSVGKIKFHKKSENFLYFIDGAFIASASFLTFGTLVTMFNYPPIAFVFGPIAALNIVIVVAISKKLPKSYIIQNWKIHVL